MDTLEALSQNLVSDPEELEFIQRLNELLAPETPNTPCGSTPCETPVHYYTESENEQEDHEQHSLEHLILVLETKIMRRFTDMENKLNSFSLKQMKRKRTGSNRCKALNRKGEVCNGYVCKNKSKHLCYAHYVLIDKQKESASYLYSRK